MKGFKFVIAFLLGCAAGFFLTAAKNGICTNNGSKFYGSEYTELLKSSAKGIASNSGSEFYSDTYIKAKYGSKVD